MEPSQTLTKIAMALAKSLGYEVRTEEIRNSDGTSEYVYQICTSDGNCESVYKWFHSLAAAQHAIESIPQMVRKLSPFCLMCGEEAIINKIRKRAEPLLSQIYQYDSFGLTQEMPDERILYSRTDFLQRFVSSDEIKRLAEHDFIWNKDTKYESKQKAIENLFTALTDIAREDLTYHGPIRNNFIRMTDKAPTDPIADMETNNQNFPEYVTIRYNGELVKNSVDGRAIMQLFAHEFQHALNACERKVDAWRVEGENDYSGYIEPYIIRLFITDELYTSLDQNYIKNNSDEDTLLELMLYFSQLEEQLAYRTEYLLYSRFPPLYFSFTFFERYGFDIFYQIMIYKNLSDFEKEGLKYLFKIGEAIPELKMIIADVALIKAQEVTGDLRTYLEDQSVNHWTLLARYKSLGNMQYILPTKRLYDIVCNNLNFKDMAERPFDWDEMISDVQGCKGS